MNHVEMFTAVFIAMFVGHGIGDYWLQTDHQAVTKNERTWRGRRACFLHVLTYTASTATLTGALWLTLGLHIAIAGFATGQLVSAVTHFWADRRFTLHWMVRVLTPWNHHYYNVIAGGAENLDQKFHWFWLYIAALLTAVIQ